MLDWLIKNSIKIFWQFIECAWWFSCVSVQFHQELVPFEVIYRKQVISIDVGILWLFWFVVLEMFKWFCHIFWHRYINITFFDILVNSQSGIITTLPISWYCTVITERLEKTICIMFTKNFYAEIVSTKTKKFSLFDVPIIQPWTELRGIHGVTCENLFLNTR